MIIGTHNLSLKLVADQMSFRLPIKIDYCFWILQKYN